MDSLYTVVDANLKNFTYAAAKISYTRHHP